MEGIIQGQTDSLLSDIGRRQADLLARFMKREGIHPDEIYASPLKRAGETAEIINGVVGTDTPIEFRDEFMEIDVGEVCGLTIDEVLRRYPGKMADVNRWLDFSNFNGESFEQFYSRVEGCVKELIKKWDDPFEKRTVFFVTHGGVTRPILKTLLNHQSDFLFVEVGNCSQIAVRWREVRGNIRRVIRNIIPINRIAEMMGEEAPVLTDLTSKKLGN
jgi:broad specificity phosphatase PhoE